MVKKPKNTFFACVELSKAKEKDGQKNTLFNPSFSPFNSKILKP